MSAKFVDRLHFISNGNSKAEQIESIYTALNAGCKWIQLRAKKLSDSEFEDLAREIKVLCDEYQSRLIINDKPHIAKRVKAFGLHLGLNDMSISDARNIVGSNMVIGGTANTFSDILFQKERGADYIGLGPYRFTETKEKLSPIVGLAGYAQIIRQLAKADIAMPIIAIGGIGLKDIQDIIQTGIYGIAISSAIIRSDNPNELIKKINTCLC